VIDGRLANPKNKRGKTEVDLRNSAINFDRRCCRVNATELSFTLAAIGIIDISEL